MRSLFSFYLPLLPISRVNRDMKLVICDHTVPFLGFCAAFNETVMSLPFGMCA